MKSLKKISVCAGIAVGSIIGGSISLAGKMAKKPDLDELGDNIIDSAILTGEIVGDAADGLSDVLAGKIQHNSHTVKKGTNTLKKSGGNALNNMVSNAKIVLNQSGEILSGVKEKDKTKIVDGIKTMGKMAIIGMVTVGAIQMDPQKEKKVTSTAILPKLTVVKIVPCAPLTARIFLSTEEVKDGLLARLEKMIRF